MKLLRVAAVLALMSATVMLPTAASAQPHTTRTVAAAATGANYASADTGISGATASAMPIELASSLAGRVNCPAQNLCLWVGVDFGDVGFGFPAGTYSADFTKIQCTSCDGVNVPGDFNDDASSWFNNTNQTYCVSWDINGGDPDNTMPPGSFGNFTSTKWNGQSWNDKASSLGFIGCP